MQYKEAKNILARFLGKPQDKEVLTFKLRMCTFFAEYHLLINITDSLTDVLKKRLEFTYWSLVIDGTTSNLVECRLLLMTEYWNNAFFRYVAEPLALLVC